MAESEDRSVLALRRLHHWAAWEYLFRINMQGWAKESAIARFMREGFLGNNNINRTSSEPYHNPKAEEVNRIFNLLKKENVIQAEVFYLYYVFNVSAVQYINERKVCRQTFYKRLGAARKFILERLGE